MINRPYMLNRDHYLNIYSYLVITVWLNLEESHEVCLLFISLVPDKLYN